MAKTHRILALAGAVCLLLSSAAAQDLTGQLNNYFALRGGMAMPQDMDIKAEGGQRI